MGELLQKIPQYELNRLLKALGYINPDDRDYWFKIGAALHHEHGELGRLIWDAWSSLSGKFDQSNDQDSTWESYTTGDRKHKSTIAKLRRIARDTGWKDPDLPPLNATLPIVTGRNFVEVATQAVSLHPNPQARSIACSGPPGMGKSTARIKHQVTLLKNGELHTSIFATHTRSLGLEKLDHESLKSFADEPGCRVVTMMGRGDKLDEEPFYCRLKEQGRSSSPGRSLCTMCSHRNTCRTTPGWYQHDSTQAREALQSQDRLFIVTTTAKMDSLLRDVLEVGRTEFECTIDDPGVEFGLCKDEVFHVNQLENYWKSIKGWLDYSDDTAPDERMISEVVHGLCKALVEPSGKLLCDAIPNYVGSLDSTIQDKVRSLQVDELVFPCEQQPASPFDGWSAPTAAIGRQLLEYVQLTLSGMAPVAKAKGSVITISKPNRFVIDAARAGRVCWLSVGPMPGFVLDALGVERVHANWHLENSVTQLTPPPRSLWAGTRMSEKRPNRNDKLIRAWLVEYTAHYQGTLGCLFTYNDNQTIGPLLERRGHRVGYYGKHQAGTNDFQGVGKMLVRRFRPSPTGICWTTTALAGCVGLDMPSLDLSRRNPTQWERRTRSTPIGEFEIQVPADLREREVYRTMEAQDMLNAIGRCRPLQNPGVEIVIADGTPVQGAPFTSRTSWQEMLEQVGGDVASVRQAVGMNDQGRVVHDKVRSRRALVSECRTQNKFATAAQIRDGLEEHGIKVSERTVRNDLKALGLPVGASPKATVPTLSRMTGLGWSTIKRVLARQNRNDSSTMRADRRQNEQLVNRALEELGQTCSPSP